MSTKKYRPYLSLSELTAISTALKTTALSSSFPLITYLDGYIIDINRGTRAASLETKPSFIETLHSTNPVVDEYQSLNLFAKWSHFPASCSPAELLIVNEYRYFHDKMTEQEERDYEKSQGL